MRGWTTVALVFTVAAPTGMGVACGGGIAPGATGDGGAYDDVTNYPDNGPIIEPYEDVSLLGDVGPTMESDGSGSSSGGGSSGGDAGMGGAPFDAGYYYGDGSFWVEGGAYPPVDSGGGGAPDAAVEDASSGCGALAACCATLSGSTQSLCNSVVSGGNAGNCATELSQLESGGDCTGVTVLAQHVQVAPYQMVSDGTTLFWTTLDSAPGLLAMPVQGGPVTTLLGGVTANPPYGAFLAVDDANVYVLADESLIRIPKNGAAPTLVNEVGAPVVAATSLGGTAYWIEYGTGSDAGPWGPVVVRSSPLQGTGIATVGGSFMASAYPGPTAVTSTTGFIELGGPTVALDQFPLAGIPASGPQMLPSVQCNGMASDTSAVYCGQSNGQNLRIASDGTITNLGSSVDTVDIVCDDTYVYWADHTTVGTIVRAPKDGSGSPTVLAYDTSPRAIAVDANSIYWGDDEGYIKSMPK